MNDIKEVQTKKQKFWNYLTVVYSLGSKKVSSRARHKLQKCYAPCLLLDHPLILHIGPRALILLKNLATLFGS